MNSTPTHKWKRVCLPAALLLAALASSLPAVAGTPLNKTISAAAHCGVQIFSVAGSIKVTAWNRNEIHIGGTLSRDAKRLAVEKTPGGVDIRVVLPHHFFGHSEGSHLAIQIPAASHLKVHTVSAGIDASGLTGPVRLKTVSGNVTVVSRAASIHVKTVSGDVRVAGSARDARIDAHSISGALHIENINGDVRAHSTSGFIRLTGDNELRGAKLGTTSGDIRLTAALAPEGNYVLQSLSGDVVLSLPKVPAARFHASSLSGSIDANFGPAPQRTSKYGPSKEWHYRHGAARAEVRIHTLSGEIRIRAAKH